MERLLEGKALVVEERLGSLVGSGGNAFVPALGADVGGATRQAGLIEDGRQGYASPLASGQDHSLLGARRARPLALEIFEVSGVAAGAFHDGANRTGGEPANVVVVQAQRLFDLAIDGEGPIADGHRVGHPKMLNDIMQLGGRDEALQVHDRSADALGLAIRPRQGNGFDLLMRPTVPGVGFVVVVRRLGAVHLQKVRPGGILSLILRGILLGTHTVCVSEV